MNLQLFAEPIKEFALANIARVDFITEETVPKTYSLTNVSTEVGVEAHISEGEEEELRVKNEIKAQNKSEDITLGYDLNFVNATMIPEILALVDGGTWDAETQKYAGPVMGIATDRTGFAVHVFAEQKDHNGDTVGYVKYVYKNCKGKPVNFNLVEGEFFAAEMSATSRPKFGESPVEFEILEELPA